MDMTTACAAWLCAALAINNLGAHVSCDTRARNVLVHGVCEKKGRYRQDEMLGLHAVLTGPAHTCLPLHGAPPQAQISRASMSS